MLHEDRCVSPATADRAAGVPENGPMVQMLKNAPTIGVGAALTTIRIMWPLKQSAGSSGLACPKPRTPLGGVPSEKAVLQARSPLLESGSARRCTKRARNNGACGRRGDGVAWRGNARYILQGPTWQLLAATMRNERRQLSEQPPRRPFRERPPTALSNHPRALSLDPRRPGDSGRFGMPCGILWRNRLPAKSGHQPEYA